MNRGNLTFLPSVIRRGFEDFNEKKKGCEIEGK
jgi:hypothetical protein